MGLILLAAAMPPEARLIAGRLAPAGTLGGREFFRGRAGGREVGLVLTGMGQVNAAQGLTAALERLGDEVEAVLGLGCAGALPGSGLRMGQVAVASDLVFADLGVWAGGRLFGLEKTGIPLLDRPEGKFWNRIPADPHWTGVLAAAAPRAPRGPFATVERISGDPQAAGAVASRWGALLEEMESAALALVAARYSLPFAAVRGVSNQAGERELDVAAGAGAAERAAWRALGGGELD